jgi:protein tyrosine phosphatase (PTP) superfamily phosphohydrolase (DUF442 family)
MFISAGCCLPCAFSRRKEAPPPPGATYEVLGRRTGLSGYLIRYSDGLYRGGSPTSPQGISALKTMGVRSLISICPSRSLRRWSADAGMNLVEIPFGPGGPSAQDRERFLRAMRQLPRPVYVHCRTGERRAGALGILYRTKMGRWDFESALHEFLRLGGERSRDARLISSVRD